MSKKTRQTVTILLLCVLLIGAGIGYYALIRYQASQQKKEQAEEESISLYQMDSSKISKLSFENKKTKLSLVKEKNVWKVENDLDFPLNQNKISTMVDSVAKVSADKLVRKPCENLEEYRLNAPDLTVEVEDSEGNQQTLAFGMESVSGGGRYGYCGDSSKVYLFSTSIYSSFDYTVNQLMRTADIPTVTADYVTGLKVQAKKGRNFEVVYDEKNSPYKNIYSWAINQPYSQPVAADVDQLQTLFESYGSLNFSEGISYHAKPEELKKYGLTQPEYQITLDYFEVEGESEETASKEDTESSTDNKKQKKIPKKLQLTIGKQNKDKTGYYVQLAGDKGIYLMETGTIESLVNITPLDYVYQRLYAGYIADVDSMDLQYRGKSYHMTIEQEKKDSESDSDTEDVSYTIKIDGRKVDSESFQNAFTDISNLAPNGEIDSKVTPESDKAVARFTFHQKKKDVDMEIYPYDGSNFYRVRVDGIMQFVVDIRTVDEILNEFMVLTEAKK